jgi:hypothetical protein
LFVALVFVGLGGSSSGAAPSEPLRMNDFQAKGSHNSYHIEQPPDVIDAYMGFDSTAFTLQYTHGPLQEQFENQGVRQIELDVFYDSTGDLFEPVDTPGFKVLHIDLIDEDSQCSTLIACLEDVRAWSDQHPSHIPLGILIELKEGIFKATGPVTPTQLVALDDEIRSVFGPNDLVTPDFVRGVGRSGGADGQGTVYPDPESAILDYGWPLLDDTRGRAMFMLDNEHDDYVNGDPTLAGRAAFPPSSPGNPDAAFLKLNDPIGDFAAIQSAVTAGYMVRTRGDLPVETGLSKDDTQLQAALASGAHWVSGDYLTPTDHERYNAAYAAHYGFPFTPVNPTYETVIPGGTPARCNPITAPPGCTSSDVEDLAAAEMPPATDPDDVVPAAASPISTRAPGSSPAQAVTAQPAVTG